MRANERADERMTQYSTRRFHDISALSASLPAPTMDVIPDLVLLRIFNMLEVKQRVKIELVCKRWLDLSRASWSLMTKFSSSSIKTDRFRRPGAGTVDGG